MELQEYTCQMGGLLVAQVRLAVLGLALLGIAFGVAAAVGLTQELRLIRPAHHPTQARAGLAEPLQAEQPEPPRQVEAAGLKQVQHLALAQRVKS